MKINRLLVGLLLFLSACKSVAWNAPAPAQADDKSGTYYFLAANNSDPFYIPGVKGFNDAGKELGVKTEFVGPMDLSLNSQMKTFEELVANPSTKGILLYLIDYKAGEPLIEEAKAKGIAVITGAADSPFPTRDAFIGYNNTVLGKQAGAWAAKLTGCKGPVGAVALASAPNVVERVQGYYDQLKASCPDIQTVDLASHDGSAANETQVLDAYMVANPDLTLLWWADGGAGQQAQVWKDKQAQGVKTMFLATDMPPATLQAVKDGVFVGSVGQDTFTEEYWGMKMLYAKAHGQRIPDTLYLSAILVDKDNVDQFMEKK